MSQERHLETVYQNRIVSRVSLPKQDRARSHEDGFLTHFEK